jgi:hypothetical protein
MKTQPTYDDAKLILRLYDMRREDRLRAARKWFTSMPALTSRAQYLQVCPAGSDENASFRMVTSYWEMAASFVSNGILNKELFYRSNNMEILIVWEKVRRMLPEHRAFNNNALAWKQIEEVAHGFIEYLNQNAPGFYEKWSASFAPKT